MGKQKKARGPRPGPPLRRTTPASSTSPLLAGIRAAKQQLQLPHFEEKLCGLQTISNALNSDEYLDLLKDEGIVRIIAPLLLDENGVVRNSSAGTLQNFSALNFEACDYLIEQGVITLLVAFFEKYTVNWIPTTIGRQFDEEGDTIFRCIHLLSNLCVSSETAVKHINDSRILPLLTRCIKRDIFGDKLVIAVFHCLMAITEDNQIATDEAFEETLKSYIYVESTEPLDVLFKILSAGLILNLKGKNMTFNSEIIIKIINVLATTLSDDLRSACHKMSSLLPIADLSEHSESESSMEPPVDDIPKRMEDLTNLFDAQQTAIEIITNFCSLDEDNGMDVEESSDADSDMETDEVEDENNTLNGVCLNSTLPLEISNMIISHGFVEKIWQKSLDVAVNVKQILQESDHGKIILHRLSAIRSRSLFCMNNFIENMPIDALGGYAGIYNFWVEIGKTVFKSNINENIEVMESATAAMRAMIDKIKVNLMKCNGLSVVNELFKDLNADDIQVMLSGISQCENSEIRVNLIRMIGNLALILLSKTSDPNIERVIPEFLLQRMLQETDCWVLSEVLDTLMDMFAEDETDQLACNLKLVDKLTTLVPIIRSKGRQQRKSLGDHYAVVNTVTINLPRFIKYKKKRVDLLKR